MENADCELIYVDEGGVGHVYGLGLSRMFRNHRFHRRGCNVLEYVEKGYKSVKSARYPSIGYLKLLSLFEIISFMNRPSNDRQRRRELCQMLNTTLNLN